MSFRFLDWAGRTVEPLKDPPTFSIFSLNTRCTKIKFTFSVTVNRIYCGKLGNRQKWHLPELSAIALFFGFSLTWEPWKVQHWSQVLDERTALVKDYHWKLWTIRRLLIERYFIGFVQYFDQSERDFLKCRDVIKNVVQCEYVMLGLRWKIKCGWQ